MPTAKDTFGGRGVPNFGPSWTHLDSIIFPTSSALFLDLRGKMVQDQYYQNLASTYPLLTRDEEVAIVRGSGGSSSAAAYPACYSALNLTVKLSFVESCQHVDTFGHNTK